MKGVAFLFPGQGSQYVGMGKDLVENFSESKNIFDQAENILNIPLRKYCFEGPSELLKTTFICQIAVFTVSMATFFAFKSRINIKPVYALGLSLGEYSALVAAGVIGFKDGLRLVKRRAELMEEIANRSCGKMCAIIGLDKQEIQRVCSECGEVYIANINSPEQIVISGKKEKVDLAKELCLQKGAFKAIDLEVSGAYHSPFMKEAADKFEEFLNKMNFSPAQIPVVSNVDTLYKREPAEIKEALVKQIYSSVLWEDSVRRVLNEGINDFYEIGPGRTLKGLMRKISSEARVINIEKFQDIINLKN